MLLAIDSGNTNVVFAVYDGETVKGVWRCHNNPKRTADEYAVWLTQLMSLSDIAPSDIDGSIIATVVPEARFNLVTVCRKYFNSDPMMIGDPALELGVKVRIDRPEQVGADRLVNTLAAHERFGHALIIIDFGTATTFDAISSKGEYLGGAISPGIMIASEALFMKASKLPRVEIFQSPQKVIGKDTASSIQSGIIYGYAGLVDGMVKRMKAEMGTNPGVIATGGLAELMYEVTETIEAVERNLTLEGLRIVSNCF